MFITMNTGGIAATNSFLIADEAAGQAVIFDAPNDTVAPLLDLAEARNWDVIGLWLTHGHFDHLADHALVKQRFPKSRLLIHELDEPMLNDPRSRIFVLPFTIPPGKADENVRDGQALSIGSIPVSAIHTPGHSPGHVMYHFPTEKVLVGGDLIIMGAVGRTDLPGSDFNQLQESIRRIMKLPGDTQLLPGHGQSSTLDEERRTNPYVREATE
jgi:glyoxylase-like metal-dependent hydrolase (beta-lactamase superfamily II)